MVCHRSEWQAPSEPPSDCLAWLSTSILIWKYAEHDGKLPAMLGALSDTYRLAFGSDVDVCGWLDHSTADRVYKKFWK